jgi:hypothetical protein
MSDREQKSVVIVHTGTDKTFRTVRIVAPGTAGPGPTFPTWLATGVKGVDETVNGYTGSTGTQNQIKTVQVANGW